MNLVVIKVQGFVDSTAQTFVKARSATCLFTYLRVKVGNSGGLNVFLAHYLHFDWCVGEVEGKVVQEVR